MDLIPIGAAAAKLQMRPSALRYYDARGLVRPSRRQGGRRMYGPTELRRLAFLKIVHQLGLPLDTAAVVLDAPADRWREAVQEQIAELERVIERAEGAQRFLTHALHCPTEHPARECATMTGALDRVVSGAGVAELAAEHTGRSVPRAVPAAGGQQRT